MNETELLDSPSTRLRRCPEFIEGTGLHDSKILAIEENDGQVIIELDYVDRWEPQDEAEHYRLVYVPARLIFEDAEIVAQTGDYVRLDELPARHAARTILWVDAVDDASADSGHPIYHFITPGDGSLAIRAESVRLEG